MVTKMGRIRPHIVAGNKGLRMLSAIVPSGWYVTKEDSVVVSNWSKPEPDLAVVRGQAEDYIDRDVTAADVAVVVEIAESSLSADQEEMAQIYAASAIPVCWIINLVDRCVEVHSEPDAAGYQSCQRIASGAEVRVVIGGVEVGRIAVAGLLPYAIWASANSVRRTCQQRPLPSVAPWPLRSTSLARLLTANVTEIVLRKGIGSGPSISAGSAPT